MKLAFVFPGQGSQSVGMMNSWQDQEIVNTTLEQAKSALDQDLAALIANGPAEDLNLTVNTQPVMLLSSIAMYKAWLAAGGAKPALMAGHSLGEYTALVAAGGIDLADGLRTVRTRAQAMQSAVPVGVGGMAAVLGLDDAAVKTICEQASTSDLIVEPVNFNAPAQVVIAGHVQAVEKACELAKSSGAKRALVLPVSAPFHSRLLKPAAAVLEKALAKIKISALSVPVVNNVDVLVQSSADAIRDALVRQAWHPVRWVETIQFMKQAGVTHIVECGPGKVLTGLIKRIDKDITCFNIFDPSSLQSTLEALGN